MEPRVGYTLLSQACNTKKNRMGNKVFLSCMYGLFCYEWDEKFTLLCLMVLFVICVKYLAIWWMFKLWMIDQLICAWLWRWRESKSVWSCDEEMTIIKRDVYCVYMKWIWEWVSYEYDWSERINSWNYSHWSLLKLRNTLSIMNHI